jgi:hypothetical protein
MRQLSGFKLMIGTGVMLLAASAAHATGSYPQPPPTTPPVGDDVVLCCSAISVPTTAPTAADPNGVFLFDGCTAINPGAYAFNQCSGVVVNCAETPAACVPSTSVAGAKDCLCGVNLNISLLLNVNLSSPALTIK